MMNTTLLSELEGLTVGRALRRSAEKWPEQEFFKSQDTSLTFTQFDRLVDQLAQSLLALGLKRHDHIAVWLGNSLEWTLCFCACARIGAVVVPINTRYTAAEAGYPALDRKPAGAADSGRQVPARYGDHRQGGRRRNRLRLICFTMSPASAGLFFVCISQASHTFRGPVPYLWERACPRRGRHSPSKSGPFRLPG